MRSRVTLSKRYTPRTGERNTQPTTWQQVIQNQSKSGQLLIGKWQIVKPTQDVWQVPKVTVATDGGYNQSTNGTFACVIVSQDRIIARASGRIPGLVTSLFRAEAWAVASAWWFLRTWLDFNNFGLLDVKLVTNSKSLIDQIKSENSSEVLLNDADVMSYIRQARPLLGKVMLTHIHSHRETVSQNGLLNDICNKMATDTFQELKVVGSFKGLHFMLAIQNRPQTGNLRKQLRMSLQQERLYQYIAKQMPHPQNLHTQIGWSITQKALLLMSEKSWKTWLKYVFGMLPTHQRLKQWGQCHSEVCPLCSKVETLEHVVGCYGRKHQVEELWKQKIGKIHPEATTDQNLLQQCKESIRFAWWGGTPVQVKQPIKRKQAEVGWPQMAKGR